jgi:lactate permease
VGDVDGLHRAGARLRHELLDAAAVGLAGQEGELFRRVLGWSPILLLVMCVLVLLQSLPILSWMVV